MALRAVANEGEGVVLEVPVVQRRRRRGQSGEKWRRTSELKVRPPPPLRPGKARSKKAGRRQRRARRPKDGLKAGGRERDALLELGERPVGALVNDLLGAGEVDGLDATLRRDGGGKREQQGRMRVRPRATGGRQMQQARASGRGANSKEGEERRQSGRALDHVERAATLRRRSGQPKRWQGYARRERTESDGAGAAAERRAETAAGRAALRTVEKDRAAEAWASALRAMERGAAIF